MVAPRLFCDICDEFDLHDTDDCPRQATEAPSPPSTPRIARAPAPPPRSYCENCEGKLFPFKNSNLIFYLEINSVSLLGLPLHQIT